jgi:hypothetical protein
LLSRWGFGYLKFARWRRRLPLQPALAQSVAKSACKTLDFAAHLAILREV